MKSIGRIGSSSECTIFTSGSGFVYQSVWYFRDIFNGRCYRMEVPGGFYSRIAREGGMARRRISAALYDQLLNECKARISEAEERSAA